jgi:hypothetical protein
MVSLYLTSSPFHERNEEISAYRIATIKRGMRMVLGVIWITFTFASFGIHGIFGICFCVFFVGFFAIMS